MENKSYFTRLIPVNGEPKLFICGKDIEFGDKVWAEDRGFYFASQMLVNLSTNAAISFKYPPIKIIAVIRNPDAWLKSDMSLDETQVNDIIKQYT